MSERVSRRVVIEHIRPEVDGGRFPVKRAIGESVEVVADVFADGHGVIQVVVRDRQVPAAGFQVQAASFQVPAASPEPGTWHLVPGTSWRETPMTPVGPGTDEWSASFDVTDQGWHEYQVVGWIDRFMSWRHDLSIKSTPGTRANIEDIDVREGAMLIREAAGRALPGDVDWLIERADTLMSVAPLAERVALALEDDLARMMARYADRSDQTESAIRHVWVDRMRGRFGAWYEMFPRSAGADATRSGTLREAARELSRIALLGFDVVYLPPVHPIGTSFRKGRNNTLVAGANDPGSPWAIGSLAGGHEAVEPGLGTVDDFVAFRKEAERLGLEVALDLAWQCSPDHPWVRDHPEWFRQRPDGSITYAENPPKKYQDIYPFDFESEDWHGLWQALLDVTRLWISRGVRIFRVDNPHTKTFGFWEWLIEEVHGSDPDVIFLAEAFTRPRPMKYLAKLGFTQSYTYFTWRNTRSELIDYFTELTATDVREYLRPNLFANTPDILHAYLQHGGRAAFEARLLLAATLGASYGIYSGFELCEATAVASGSEEYADSEKYQYRKRQWDRPGNINELVRRVNRIRHEHRALQSDWSLRFLGTDNDQIIAFTKASPDRQDRVMAIVNLDPHHMQHGFVEVPVDLAGYLVIDLLDGTEYTWRRGWNYVRFDPGVRQGHVLQLPLERG